MRRAILALGLVIGALVAAPAAHAVDVYQYANGCYALRDAATGRYVVRDTLG